MIATNIMKWHKITATVLRESCQHLYKTRHDTYLVPYLGKCTKRQRMGTMVQRLANHQMPHRPTRYSTSLSTDPQKIPFKIKAKTTIRVLGFSPKTHYYKYTVPCITKGNVSFYTKTHTIFSWALSAIFLRPYWLHHHRWTPRGPLSGPRLLSCAGEHSEIAQKAT